MKRPYSTTTTTAVMPYKRRKTYVPRYAPRQFSRGEWKYLDTTINTQINSDVPTLTLCNGIAPGNSATTRIGVKLSIRSIEMRLSLFPDTVGGLLQRNRFFLVIDRQANGAAPGALADIITPGTVSGVRSLVNRKRFKIMLDKTCVIGPTAQQGAARYYHIYMKLRRPLIVEYNAGVAGTVADIVSNSLYFCTVGSELAGNTDSNITGVVRIRYTDI